MNFTHLSRTPVDCLAVPSLFVPPTLAAAVSYYYSLSVVDVIHYFIHFLSLSFYFYGTHMIFSYFDIFIFFLYEINIPRYGMVCSSFN